MMMITTFPTTMFSYDENSSVFLPTVFTSSFQPFNFHSTTCTLYRWHYCNRIISSPNIDINPRFVDLVYNLSSSWFSYHFLWNYFVMLIDFHVLCGSNNLHIDIRLQGLIQFCKISLVLQQERFSKNWRRFLSATTVYFGSNNIEQKYSSDLPRGLIDSAYHLNWLNSDLN